MSNKNQTIKHSLAVASNSKVLQLKNDKKILRKEYRQTCRSITNVATDIITLQAHTNSLMTHQRSFALVSNLNKIYQQLAKTVPHGSEQQIFGDDLRKRVEGIGNNKQFFERENAYYSNKKVFKRFPQTLETFTRNSTNNTKATDTTAIARTVAPTKRGNSQRNATMSRYH